MRSPWRPRPAPTRAASARTRRLWGATALLHDFDYEIHPTLDQHPAGRRRRSSARRAIRKWLIEAVLSHAEHLHMERDTPLKKTLFACDEISGFVHACGLVRPLGLEGLEPKSVKKKLKQPSFAAGVHRDEVYAGAELLELSLDEHIVNVVAALQPISRGARPAHRAARSRRRRRAARRSRSSSLVHQPQEARTRPVPGRSRTTTSCSASRATSAGGSLGSERDERRVGRNELGVRSEQLAAAARLLGGALEPPVRRAASSAAASPASADGGEPVRVEARRTLLRLEATGRLVGRLREVARSRDPEPLGIGDDERAGRVRAAQPLLAGDRVEVEAARVDGDRARGLGAVDEDRDPASLAQLVHGQDAPVVQSTCESASSRVRGVTAARIASASAGTTTTRAPLA